MALIFEEDIAFGPDARSTLTARARKVRAERNRHPGERRIYRTVRIRAPVQPLHASRKMFAFVKGLAEHGICANDQQSGCAHRKRSDNYGQVACATALYRFNIGCAERFDYARHWSTTRYCSILPLGIW